MVFNSSKLKKMICLNIFFGQFALNKFNKKIRSLTTTNNNNNNNDYVANIHRKINNKYVENILRRV